MHPRMKFLPRLFLLLCILILPRDLQAQTWPTNANWIPMIDALWSPLHDANDQSKDALDIIPDQYGRDAYYYSTQTNLFIRIMLQGTPEKRGKLSNGTWFAALDVNADGYPDWAIRADGGDEYLRTLYNGGLDNEPEIVKTALRNPISSGAVRTVAAGYTGFSSGTYLDIRIAYTDLQVSGYQKNISYDTPFKMLYGVSLLSNLSFSDLTGNSSSLATGFTNAPPIARGHYGSIYDTRDTTPYSNGGLWTAPEIVSLRGNGWPKSGSVYFNSGVRHLRILNSSGTLAWYGNATTDASGVIAPVALWTLTSSVAAGTYTITVESPLQPGVYYSYDTFTINTLPPNVPLISISKTVSDPSVAAGAAFNYTITLTNTGTGPGQASEIHDILPSGFSYIPGSASGFTTIEPVISGQELVWYGYWTINPPSVSPNFIALTFGVTTQPPPGQFFNSASAVGTNFTLVQTGPTAPVTLTAPEPGSPVIAINSTASSDTVGSSSPVDYSIEIQNTGTATATITFVQDELPVGFTYVPGSTTGFTSADPVVTGSQLSWTGAWVINYTPGSNFLDLTFRATAPMVRDTYFNSATVSGLDFPTLNTGPTAEVYVAVPQLTLNRIVDKINPLPGDTVTYTVTYINIGDAAAKMVILLESIPANTSYIENSVTGAAMTISFSHDWGLSYNSDQTAPVTNIQFTRSADLAPAASGSVSLKVLIK